jgi:hypothetical protein
MRARWVLVLVGAFVLTACSGGTDYQARFDELVPAGWTLDVSTGAIDDGCDDGARCGSIERKYYLNSSQPDAFKAMEAHYKTKKCRAVRAGGGISVDCADVHLAISVTGEMATLTMTKRQPA